jgi:hypothetical protein
LNHVIHLVNNADLLAAIESPESRLALAAKSGKAAAELVEIVFVATLSRRPTEHETALVVEHITKTADSQNSLARFREGEPPGEPSSHVARTEPRPPRITTAHLAALRDLQHALINSNEFLLRH